MKDLNSFSKLHLSAKLCVPSGQYEIDLMTASFTGNMKMQLCSVNELVFNII